MIWTDRVGCPSKRWLRTFLTLSCSISVAGTKKHAMHRSLVSDAATVPHREHGSTLTAKVWLNCVRRLLEPMLFASTCQSANPKAQCHFIWPRKYPALIDPSVC